MSISTNHKFSGIGDELTVRALPHDQEIQQDAEGHLVAGVGHDERRIVRHVSPGLENQNAGRGMEEGKDMTFHLLAQYGAIGGEALIVDIVRAVEKGWKIAEMGFLEDVGDVQGDWGERENEHGKEQSAFRVLSDQDQVGQQENQREGDDARAKVPGFFPPMRANLIGFGRVVQRLGQRLI